MKRIILISLLLMAAVLARAQDGLNINRLFDGRFRKNPDATETIIKGGSSLASQGLSRYHSLTLKGAAASSAAEAEALVLKDAARAISKEASYIDGHLYYGFFVLKPDFENRYIFYLNQHLKGGNRLILIYLQGDATPAKIKSILKK